MTGKIGRPAADEVENKTRVTVNKPVLIGSGTAIVAMALWAIFLPQSAQTVLGTVVEWISRWFGSFYIVLATIILVFVLYLGFSRFGNTRLGPPNSRPEFSTFSWASMLFAAGIGTDIMFFSVAEPIAQYMEPPVGDGQTIAAAREATVWTLFHYGITGWGMYALMGMALGYFAYRRGRPLAVRSALYPVFGKKMDGPFGTAVDVAAILGTIFGVATTLGIGVVQLNVGLEILFGIERGLTAQVGLVILAVVVATLSATSGIEKGIRFLSQLNVILAIFLAGWVLVTGKTEFLINAIVMNIGDFVSSFPSRTLDTFAYSDVLSWMSGWTLFFWAWWVAWASFVGMFLARISRGRTIREFVAGTMVIPFMYIVMWISIFGNAAIGYVREGNLEFAEMTLEVPELGFYTLLQEYPAATLMIGVATFVGLLFYVTSADSGALVMANLSSHLPTARDDAASWVRIFWATVTGLLTIGVLIVGGIPALQNATIVMGLPFSFVMIFVMTGLYKALSEDEIRMRSREQSMRNIVTGAGSVSELASASWRDRLARTFVQVSPNQASGYLDRVVQPALEKVAAELRKQGIFAEVVRGGNENVEDVSAETTIHDRVKFVAMEGENQFVYRILAIDTMAPIFLGAMSNRSRDTSTRLEVHLPQGGQDYDVMGYSADAIIHDVLDHFDRHQDYLRVREEVIDS